MRLGVAEVAGLPQVKAPHRLREGSFNAGPSGILPLKVGRLLACPGGVHGVELGPRAQGEGPGGGLRPGAVAAPDRPGKPPEQTSRG